MGSACFITQEATENILQNVTTVCAECYNDLNTGDTIHYDMQSYRYLCQSCQEKLCSIMNENCEVVEEESQGLF